MKVVLQNLTKQFPSRDKKSSDVVIAVSNFTFEIPDGKLIGLLGPSGCGKSTALNLISGLIAPTSGRIFFGDDDVTDLPPENRGVGLVFQSYALYPHLTVRQNIMFPLENLKGAERPSKAEMERRVLEAARLVQIENLLDRKPGEMSGGQQQRVAIARAVVKMPKVLLLDEPLSNLDARLRLQTREEIRRIQRDTGITTVFVTHDQEEAMSISDMIVVMKEGVVQQIGKPQAVYDDPINLFVSKFLGTPPINVFGGVVKGGRLFIRGRREGRPAVHRRRIGAGRARRIGRRGLGGHSPRGLHPRRKRPPHLQAAGRGGHGAGHQRGLRPRQMRGDPDPGHHQRGKRHRRGQPHRALFAEAPQGAPVRPRHRGAHPLRHGGKGGGAAWPVTSAKTT